MIAMGIGRVSTFIGSFNLLVEEPVTPEHVAWPLALAPITILASWHYFVGDIEQ